MNYKQIWDELERIHCTSTYFGNIEGIGIEEYYDNDYIRFYDDCQEAYIHKDLIKDFFNKLQNNCGCRIFWNLVHDFKKQNKCNYSEKEE